MTSRSRDRDGGVLAVECLSLSFGGVHALDGVSMEVAENSIRALIGPNGAGKTSLLNAISGYYRPDAGRIGWLGRDLVGLPIHRISRLGIRRTYQNLQLFGRLSAMENISVGAGLQPGSSAETRARQEQLVELLKLGPVLNVPVVDLPYGTQRMVELARAFAGNPRLVLLDEPAAGLNDEEATALGHVLQKLAAQWHVGVLIIEHNVELVMRVAHQVTVLDHGEVIASGPPREVTKSPKVREAYLGSGGGHNAGR